MESRKRPHNGLTTTNHNGSIDEVTEINEKRLIINPTYKYRQNQPVKT